MENKYTKILFIELAYNNDKLIGVALFDKIMFSLYTGFEILK